MLSVVGAFSAMVMAIPSVLIGAAAVSAGMYCSILDDKHNVKEILNFLKGVKK